MIANVKFHVTRCHAVTPYKSVTLPETLPQGQFYYGYFALGAIATVLFLCFKAFCGHFSGKQERFTQFLNGILTEVLNYASV